MLTGLLSRGERTFRPPNEEPPPHRPTRLRASRLDAAGEPVHGSRLIDHHPGGLGVERLDAAKPRAVRLEMAPHVDVFDALEDERLAFHDESRAGIEPRGTDPRLAPDETPAVGRGVVDQRA